ncbi:hypothetical protein PRZ48_005236 [Zasmidium cellare]|uniref:Uncharacterized protein n=1 Tax=Zasmidium cellare TaxID=395010 RepID=A0ABR0ES71_ZASCE|nr:hypothetical protein PRZ48_005236 [Zasmidium cellare]
MVRISAMVAASYLSLVVAHPSPVVEQRDLIGSVISSLGADATNAAKVASAFLDQKIYPRSSPSDPAYSLPESTLLGSIHIPNTFTYGTKPPVFLFPGTGVPGGITFAYTYARLLDELPYADPIWLNIPRSSLDDAQLTAEHAVITSRNVSVTTFSQGSLNLQWAFTFFA